MKVAVCVNSNDFVTRLERERHFGGIGGIEILHLIAVLGFKHCKFDIVRFGCRVHYATHAYSYSAALLFIYRHVLFLRSIGRTCNQFLVAIKLQLILRKDHVTIIVYIKFHNYFLR